jgi:hypothetical protein
LVSIANRPPAAKAARRSPVTPLPDVAGQVAERSRHAAGHHDEQPESAQPPHGDSHHDDLDDLDGIAEHDPRGDGTEERGGSEDDLTARRPELLRTANPTA